MNDKQKNIQGRKESTKRRHELILDTAIECFVAKGFHQTSVRDIAIKAGISVGNLYNHFDSKESLIAEIAEIEAVEISKIETLLADTQNPFKTIKRFVDIYLAEAGQFANAVLSVEIAAEVMRNPEIGKQFSANRQKIVKGLKSLLLNGIKAGQFDPGLNKEEVAELIIDAIEGLAYRAVSQGGKISIGSIKSLNWNIKKLIQC